MGAYAKDTGGLPVVRPTPLVGGHGARQGLRLMSDTHIGAANVDYALIERELDEAGVQGDRILLGGDVWDFILPADRKRYTPAALHPRLQGRGDIVNAAVEWAEELFGPYADLIDGVGVGNHETSVEQHHSLDASRLLVAALNRARSPGQKPVAQLGYTAFLEYRIVSEATGKQVGRYIVWYHHGAGKAASAPAALRALIQKTNVFAADLYWSGHSHCRAHSTEVMIHCGRDGRPCLRDVKCVVTGSYMVPYAHQSQESMVKEGRRSNYAAEAGYAPGGLGGARVVLRWDAPGFPSKVEVIQ